MQAMGWYNDTPKNFDGFTNDGFIFRQGLFSYMTKDSEGKAKDRIWPGDSVFFRGPLFTDLDGTSGLYSGIKIKIELHRAMNDFVLMGSHAGAKFELEEVTIQVPIGVLHPSLALRIEHRLSSSAMKMNFRRRNLIPFQVPLNSTSFYSDSKYANNYVNYPENNMCFFLALFSTSQPPLRMLITFLPTKNFHGSQDTNPYNFGDTFAGPTVGKDFKITDVKLTLNDALIDGLEYVNSKAQFLKNFVLADAFTHNQGNGMTLENFCANGGNFHLLYDMTTALEGNIQLVSPVARSGLGRLSVTFSRSTSTELTVLVLLEYASLLEIDKNRNIHMKYGV